MKAKAERFSVSNSFSAHWRTSGCSRGHSNNDNNILKKNLNWLWNLTHKLEILKWKLKSDTQTHIHIYIIQSMWVQYITWQAGQNSWLIIGNTLWIRYQTNDQNFPVNFERKTNDKNRISMWLILRNICPNVGVSRSAYSECNFYSSFMVICHKFWLHSSL